MIDIPQKLTSLFESVETPWRESRVAFYRGLAETQTASYLDKLTEKTPYPKGASSATLYHFIDKGEYVSVPDGAEPYNWALRVEWASTRLEGFVPNYEKAERDANAEVDRVKAGFISKMSVKLGNAFGLRSDLDNLSGQLRYGGVIEGWLKAMFTNGDEFTITMSIIVNYRYGGWAGRNGFFQFPARFGAIKLGAGKKNSASEAWMLENFNKP